MQAAWCVASKLVSQGISICEYDTFGLVTSLLMYIAIRQVLIPRGQRWTWRIRTLHSMAFQKTYAAFNRQMCRTS
jgi:hypothetical protein